MTNPPQPGDFGFDPNAIYWPQGELSESEARARQLFETLCQLASIQGPDDTIFAGYSPIVSGPPAARGLWPRRVSRPVPTPPGYITSGDNPAPLGMRLCGISAHPASPGNDNIAAIFELNSNTSHTNDSGSLAPATDAAVHAFHLYTLRMISPANTDTPPAFAVVRYLAGIRRRCSDFLPGTPDSTLDGSLDALSPYVPDIEEQTRLATMLAPLIQLYALRPATVMLHLFEDYSCLRLPPPRTVGSVTVHPEAQQQGLIEPVTIVTDVLNRRITVHGNTSHKSYFWQAGRYFTGK